jgi:hypothetical protein
MKIETDIENILRQDELPKLLDQHKGLNFVQRILNPRIYPNKPLPGGDVATHRMAWGEADGKYFAYPTVVQGGDGKLVELPPEEAFKHAVKTGEFIEFSSGGDADWFSKNYKRVWDR